MNDLIIIGGGLAGSEAAWQAAEQGITVTLYEMRPNRSTGAHVSDQLAELVCSNSLGSNLPDRSSGLLKEELRRLGSLLLECAEKTALPAGGALAVDRAAFSNVVTQHIQNHPRIHIVREEIKTIPSGPTIIASGPLTSPDLAKEIQKLTGEEHLYFFDAIAPIIHFESINMEIAFRASRYEEDSPDEGDYINCPLNQQEYEIFVEELLAAQRIQLREFEQGIQSGVKAGIHRHFEGCLPVEVIAQRGKESLAFGPMRPVGLRDPRTGKWPYAAVQLRQDSLAGDLYNMVGFQTNLTYAEQKRIFRTIPGLENAQFERYGQMHRNTFIASPVLLYPTLQYRNRNDLFFAGQITGVEGYMGNIATGLLAGLNAARLLQDKPLIDLPRTTMLGGLCYYISHADIADFQPMKANYNLLPSIGKKVKGKRIKAGLRKDRSLNDLNTYLDQLGMI